MGLLTCWRELRTASLHKAVVFSNILVLRTMKGTVLFVHLQSICALAVCPLELHWSASYLYFLCFFNFFLLNLLPLEVLKILEVWQEKNPLFLIYCGIKFLTYIDCFMINRCRKLLTILPHVFVLFLADQWLYGCSCGVHFVRKSHVYFIRSLNCKKLYLCWCYYCIF